jgi:hypothetical protein
MDPSPWVEQQLVPTMEAHGSFGDRSKQRVETTKCKVVNKTTSDDHLTSTVLFINLELNFEHQALQAYNLFVKVTPEDTIHREFFDTCVLFHNEIHMYTEVIPFVEEFLRKRQVHLLGEIFVKC